MKYPIRILVLLASLASGVSAAQTLVTEVIPVSYRPVEEVLTILKPLVPKPGTVTGIYGQLVVRTTPENLQEIKQVLASIDRSPRSLLITVRHGISEDFSFDKQEAFGTLRKGDITVSTGRSGRGRSGLTASIEDEGSKAGVRVLSTHSTSEDRDVQKVRVLEGREAFIRTGESVPVAERSLVIGNGVATTHDTIRYRDVTSGFAVVPRLSGDRVFLDIAPRRSRLSNRGGGAIDVQQAVTTVSGRLGEWIEIGGAAEEQYRRDGGILHSTRSRGSTDHTIYLKVEEVR